MRLASEPSGLHKHHNSRLERPVLFFASSSFILCHIVFFLRDSETLVYDAEPDFETRVEFAETRRFSWTVLRPYK